MKQLKALRIFLFCLIIYLNTYASLAQDLVQRYFTELPESVVENLFERVRIEKNLHELTQIHTDLIFWYIEYLNNRINDIQFLQIKQLYLKQKISWLIEARKYIQEYGQIDSTLLNSVPQFQKLPQNLTKTQSFPGIKGEHKRIAYFTLKYYAPTWNVAYDSIYNYETVIRKLQYERRKILIQRSEHSANLEQLTKIIDHWYLFNQSQRLKEQAYQLMINILRRQQTNTKLLKKNWHLAIGSGYKLNLAQIYSSYVLHFTFLNLKETFTLNGGGLFGEFEYLFRSNSIFTTIYLRNNLQLVSYFAKNQKTYRKRKYFYKEDIYNFHEKLKYNVQLKDWHTFGLILKSTFPIYLGKQNLAIEFGVLTGILKHFYTIIFDYYFQRIKGYWGDFYGKEYYETFLDLEKEDVIKMKRSEMEYLIFPILRIHLFLIKDLQLEVTGNRNYLTIEIKKVF